MPQAERRQRQQERPQPAQQTPQRRSLRNATEPLPHVPPRYPPTFWSPFTELFAIYFCPPQSFYIIKDVFLREGHGVAALYVVAAAIVNHLRRFLLPWFGEYMWRDPLKHLKLARHAPHYFLEEIMDFNPIWALWWTLQFGAFTIVKLFVWTSLLQEEEPRRSKTAVAIIMIIYLSLGFAAMEYDYAELCWTGSVLYALQAVLRGTPEQRAYFFKLLKNSDLVLRSGAQVIGIVHAIQKTYGRMNSGWVSALSVFVVALFYVTAHIVKYSNKYFIFLEVSEMLLTWIWIILGVGMVAIDKVIPW